MKKLCRLHDKCLEFEEEGCWNNTNCGLKARM